jgi:hypothetical protein
MAYPEAPEMRSGTPALVLFLMVFTVAACDELLPRPAPVPSSNVPAPNVPAPPSPAPPGPPTGSAVRLTTPGAPTSTTDPIIGQYQLDVVVGPQCSSIPEEVRNRSYIATVTLKGNYLISLSEGSFLHDASCQQSGPPSGLIETPPVCNQMVSAFDDFRDGYIWFAFSQKWPYHSKPIVERLAGGAWLEVDGTASGPLQGQTPTAVGPVTLSYWFGEPVGSSYATCRSDDARLVFTRR